MREGLVSSVLELCRILLTDIVCWYGVVAMWQDGLMCVCMVCVLVVEAPDKFL